MRNKIGWLIAGLLLAMEGTSVLAQKINQEPKMVTSWDISLSISAPTPERLREQIKRAIKLLEETPLTERQGTHEEWHSTPHGFPNDLEISEWTNRPDNNNWTEAPDTFGITIGRGATIVGLDKGRP